MESSEKWQSGDVDAFEALFHRYKAMVFKTVYKQAPQKNCSFTPNSPSPGGREIEEGEVHEVSPSLDCFVPRNDIPLPSRERNFCEDFCKVL